MPDRKATFSYPADIRPAFLGHMANRLDSLIGRQSEAMLAEAGAKTPRRSVSVMLFLLQHGDASIADMARRDGQSHQLIASRIGPLETLGLIVTMADPDDERRKLCRLTPQGRDDAQIVAQVARKIAVSLTALNREIGFDLMGAIEAAEKSLSKVPLYER